MMKAVNKTAYYLLKRVTVYEDMLMQITSHTSSFSLGKYY